MKYNDDANLDTSEVSDVRGSSGGGSAAGGGIAGLLIGLLLSGRRGRMSTGVVVVALLAYVAVQYFGSGSGGFHSALDNLGSGGRAATADNAALAKECRTGRDANQHLECAIVADINSIQDFWTAELPALGRQYVAVKTVFFSGSVSTACGSASSSSGPFYCPGDKLVYIDLTFYDQLKSQFGATGGPLVNAYVLAHEYGHHVQDLLGTEARVRSREGATSDSVKLELQADCYAGVWVRHAGQPGPDGVALVDGITQADLDGAIDTAQRIGDDYIQKNLGSGTVNPDSFTHGTSAQRKKWLTTGYRTGDPRACDTFSARDLG